MQDPNVTVVFGGPCILHTETLKRTLCEPGGMVRVIMPFWGRGINVGMRAARNQHHG